MELKIKALWLAKGDEITKYVHNDTNYKKNINTISEMKREDGSMVKIFHDIA
jgi:hypothetical protein